MNKKNPLLSVLFANEEALIKSVSQKIGQEQPFCSPTVIRAFAEKAVNDTAAELVGGMKIPGVKTFEA
ncbi:MAG: hypothetical protein K9G62_06955 [Alphaproteobacteria bacterium]|nr:hypothetical protein [Alphaproteobacteria bacterium]